MRPVLLGAVIERRLAVQSGLLARSRWRVKECAGATARGGVIVRLPNAGPRLLTKRQLAAELGRSTRWVELRMREGLPVEPRRTPGEHTRFDLHAVRAWLDTRAERLPVALEERVARLERGLATLAAEIERRET
jgi:hypothetical protein